MARADAASAHANYAGAASDGSRVFVSTDKQLVSGDTDSQQDVYERSGGTTSWVSQGEINGNDAFWAWPEGASSDGSRYFFHTAEQLVSGDTDNSEDIYERSGGTTHWVSQGDVNGNGALDVEFQRISDDGSRVFFETEEPLVSGDTDSESDIYERSGGTTHWVSQGDVNGNGAFVPAFQNASSDGSRALFTTQESLVSGDTDGQVDVYERSGGTTTWVSQGQIGGNGAFGTVFGPGLSSDGSKVFFWTAEKLVSGDTDTRRDLYERSGGTTTWISQGQIGGNGAFDVSGRFDASSDGSRIFFETSEKLVSGDTDSQADIYERSGGTTTWVTQGEVNGNGPFAAEGTNVTSDGLQFIFTTEEPLVSGDTDGQVDVYERSGGTTTWVSQGEIGGNGAFGAGGTQVSSDGSKAFFATREQLVSGDTDSEQDVYERSGGTTTWVSQGQIGGNDAFDAGYGSASSDGLKFFFGTDEQLVSDDTDNEQDVYERSEGTTKLVSTVSATPPETTIDSGPTGTTNDPTPTFAFSSSEPGASFECKVDADVYAACSSPKTTASLADGSHTFYVRAINNSVTDPSPAERSFTVDTEAPETTITSGPSDPNPTNDNTPTFGFSSNEPGSTFECRFDNDVFATCSGTGSHTPATPLTDGEHTFYVRATDPAGNTDATPSSRSFTVDTQAPAPPQITDTDPDSPANDNSPVVTGSAEAGSTVALYESPDCTGAVEDQGSAAAFASPGLSASVVDDATATFSATAIDGSNNTSPCSSPFDYREDSTAPETQIDSGPTGATSDTAPTFGFSADEPSSSFQCRFDSNPPSACSGPGQSHTAQNALAYGAHTFEVWATDQAGNTDPTPAVRSFTVDPPVTSASEDAPAGATVSTNTAVTPDDPVGSSVTTPVAGTVTIDEGSTTTPTPTGYSLVGQQVEISAPDASAADPLVLEFFLDASLLSPGIDETNLEIFRNGTAIAECDSGAGSTATPDPCVATRTATTEGVEFTVRTSQASSWNFGTVDTTAPNTTITSGPQGATNDPTPTFGFSSSEAGSSFQCRVDSNPYAACTSPKTIVHLTDGSHTFSVRATDPGQNTDSTPATRSLTVRTAEVKVSGSTLVVTAAAGAKDNLAISKPSPSTLRVTDSASGAYTGSGVHTGAGCTRSGDYTANCSASGITLIQVSSGDQIDKLTNSTTIKSSLNGGAANDLLTGGSANDTLTGSTGADTVKGMNGNDQLLARDLVSDTTIDCGAGTADKADLDLLPKDPNPAVIGCETKTRH
jgi:hypothetical protein